MIQHILQRFGEWEHLGTQVASDASRRIAHTPRNYAEAYRHHFFALVEGELWNYGVD